MLVKDHILLTFLKHSVSSQEEKAEPLLDSFVARLASEFFCQIGFHFLQIEFCDVISEVLHVCVDDPLERFIFGSVFIRFDESY